MTAALPIEVADGWRQTGRLAAYEEFLRSVAADCANVRVLPIEQFSVEPTRSFFDSAHLQPRPLRVYGEQLSKVILKEAELTCPR